MNAGLATGQTPEQYEASVRAQLSTQQVQAGITGTSFAPRAQMEATLNAFYDRREVQVVRFDPADLKAKINPTDAELDTYYKEHAARFQLPESIDIEYLVLDLESVKKKASPSARLNSELLRAEQGALWDQGRTSRQPHPDFCASRCFPQAVARKPRPKPSSCWLRLQKAPATFGDVARKNLPGYWIG